MEGSCRAVSGCSVAMADRYDVIIIGSGAGGGTLAQRLAPSGKKILILERGDWLPREARNWSVEDVFGVNRYVSPALLSIFALSAKSRHGGPSADRAKDKDIRPRRITLHSRRKAAQAAVWRRGWRPFLSLVRRSPSAT